MIIRHHPNGKVTSSNRPEAMPADGYLVGEARSLDASNLALVPLGIGRFSLEGMVEGLNRDASRRAPMPYDKFLAELRHANT